jgi:hypothetical protein
VKEEAMWEMWKEEDFPENAKSTTDPIYPLKRLNQFSVGWPFLQTLSVFVSIAACASLAFLSLPSKFLDFYFAISQFGQLLCKEESKERERRRRRGREKDVLKEQMDERHWCYIFAVFPSPRERHSVHSGHERFCEHLRVSKKSKVKGKTFLMKILAKTSCALTTEVWLSIISISLWIFSTNERDAVAVVSSDSLKSSCNKRMCQGRKKMRKQMIGEPLTSVR